MFHLGKRIKWSDATKTIILKTAVQARFSARNLPCLDTLLGLAAAISIPTGLGKRAYQNCLTKLVSLIDRLVCEAKLYPGLIETSTSKSSYECHWARFMQTDIVENNSFSFTDINPAWLQEHFQASTGHYFRSVKSSGMGKTDLIKQAVSAMVRNHGVRRQNDWLSGLPSSVPFLPPPATTIPPRATTPYTDSSTSERLTHSHTTTLRAYQAWCLLKLQVIKVHQDKGSKIPSKVRESLGLSADLKHERRHGLPYNSSENYERLVMKNQSLFHEYFGE